ncbi:hypothetical protein LR48_Vigan07g091400 [Vigna angularis]|uniref:Ubiquitin-like protease family profile domain-containing protein n=1 Tax=Phaseolus angularis TaxID=3914 RepID=A0A0L9UWH5_PHAAN|nr:hypothetical protein LR48_Vigan07g091400 [Vigna angularis]
MKTDLRTMLQGVIGKSQGQLVKILYPKVCNQQLDSWECGFYVMCWIKTIIRVVSTDDWNENRSKTPDSPAKHLQHIKSVKSATPFERSDQEKQPRVALEPKFIFRFHSLSSSSFRLFSLALSSSLLVLPAVVVAASGDFSKESTLRQNPPKENDPPSDPNLVVPSPAKFAMAVDALTDNSLPASSDSGIKVAFTYYSFRSDFPFSLLAFFAGYCEGEAFLAYGLFFFSFILVRICECWWHEEATTTFRVEARRRGGRRPFLPYSWFVHAWRGSDLEAPWSRQSVSAAQGSFTAKRLRIAIIAAGLGTSRLLEEVWGCWSSDWGLGI